MSKSLRNDRPLPTDRGRLTLGPFAWRIRYFPGIALLAALCLAFSLAASSPTDEPPRFVGPEVLAHATTTVEPVYPHSALRQKIESRVTIDAYVEKDGSVYSTVIVSGDLKLVDAAEAAAKQWKFRPFEIDGQPTRAIARVVFEMKPPVVKRASR
jgi:protein TonB